MSNDLICIKLVFDCCIYVRIRAYLEIIWVGIDNDFDGMIDTGTASIRELNFLFDWFVCVLGKPYGRTC